MKKVLAIALALCMIFALCACAKEQPAATPAATAAAPAESPAEAPAAAEAPKADFSQNVNVARASDYAKESLERPVTGIGRAISTDVKANKEYTIVCMTKNSTNPYMVGMWDGAKQAGEDMNINVVVAAPAVDDSIEEQVNTPRDALDNNIVGESGVPSSGLSFLSCRAQCRNRKTKNRHDDRHAGSGNLFGMLTQSAQSPRRRACTGGTRCRRAGCRPRRPSRRPCRHSPSCPRWRAWA